MNDDFRQTYLLHVMAATHFSVRRFKQLPAASNTRDSKKNHRYYRGAVGSREKTSDRISFVIYLLFFFFC